MQKREQTASKISYAVMALLLLTYVLFPSWYRAVSQKVLGAIYVQHAQSLRNDTPIVSNDEAHINPTLVPIFTIVRPPQAPYDYLITTIPENQQFRKYKKGTWYVYDEKERPVGFIEKAYPTMLIVTLFSAPGSNEVFSVNDYVSRGRGEGGGGFSLQVPIDMEIAVGESITHQATGKIVSTVIAVNSIPEKNIQEVVGVLQRSPFEMATVYVAHTAPDAILSDPVESAIDAVKSIAKDAQDAQNAGEAEQAISETVPE